MEAQKTQYLKPAYPIVKMILHYPCEVTVLNSVDSTNKYIKTLSLGDVPRAVIALMGILQKDQKEA